jgi:DNA-binding XRE family transcriptional regulator
MPDAEQNRTPDGPFPWSEASAEAAVLLAEDRLTDATIAKRVGVSRTTLHTWKQHPEFSAKITEHYNELIERARRRGIARLDRRMDAYEDRHKRMSALLRERAKDMKGEVAGGGTGTMVRTPKRVEILITTVVVDEDGEQVSKESTTTREELYEYQFDAALLRELRELEKQVAQDTGQWSEKREVSGPDGGPVPITTIQVALDPDLTGDAL